MAPVESNSIVCAMCMPIGLLVAGVALPSGPGGNEPAFVPVYNAMAAIRSPFVRISCGSPRRPANPVAAAFSCSLAAHRRGTAVRALGDRVLGVAVLEPIPRFVIEVIPARLVQLNALLGGLYDRGRRRWRRRRRGFGARSGKTHRCNRNTKKWCTCDR